MVYLGGNDLLSLQKYFVIVFNWPVTYHLVSYNVLNGQRMYKYHLPTFLLQKYCVCDTFKTKKLWNKFLWITAHFVISCLWLSPEGFLNDVAMLQFRHQTKAKSFHYLKISQILLSTKLGLLEQGTGINWGQRKTVVRCTYEIQPL